MAAELYSLYLPIWSLDPPPVHERVLTVDRIRHPPDDLEPEPLVQPPGGIGLEHHVEHERVEAEPASVADRALDERPPEPPASVIGMGQ